MDKLGATCRDASTVMVDLASLEDVANGPEDLPDWDTIGWHHQETQVQRLRLRYLTSPEHVHGTHVEDAWVTGQQRATDRWKGLA